MIGPDTDTGQWGRIGELKNNLEQIEAGRLSNGKTCKQEPQEMGLTTVEHYRQSLQDGTTVFYNKERV